MAMRMLTPWKNPRSENLWFRRRVPAKLVAFMGRREIKFSLSGRLMPNWSSFAVGKRT
jgi:hypothetical protein